MSTHKTRQLAGLKQKATTVATRANIKTGVMGTRRQLSTVLSALCILIFVQFVSQVYDRDIYLY
jgi:hypothetical protein